MRRVFPLVLFLALLAPTGPVRAESCTSDLPVTDKHLASHTCTGVHPGMALKVYSAKWKGDVLCTAGWAFTDSAKNKYLSVPGTCILDFDCLEDLIQPYPPPLDQLPIPALPTCTLAQDSELEPYYKKGTGPIVKDGMGARIGRLAYAVNKNGINWGLVRLDPGIALDPKLPLYGGPVRTGAVTLSPDQAYAYCAPVSHPSVNAYSGVVYALGAAAYLYAQGMQTYVQGCPVMTEGGNAVGTLTGTLYIPLGYGIQGIDPAVSHLASRVGLHVTLLKAPLAP